MLYVKNILIINFCMVKKLIPVFFIILLFFSVSLLAQVKSYTTKKIQENAPFIDGVLNDKCWNLVEWGDDFVQREPYEGKEPSQETYFKILYDDNNLYVGIFAHDSTPELIERRLSRRDGFEGDWVEINIDSYYDKMTAFSFTVNAAGVKGDEFITDDGDMWDVTWDPIWYVKTNITDSGWIAEMRIPFRQLRFGKKDNHIWGIQLTRRFFRKEERSTWQFISKEENGWVSHFGELHGIKNINPKKPFDLMPYGVAKLESYKEEKGNPFATGNEFSLNAGLDGKIGLTNDLTLDLTINPDFGQVEADPSVVNLTAFETFYREKRPFFIEGKNILNFQISGGGNSYSMDNLFYSRRIGRNPHYYPDLNSEEYADIPENTTILGAVKITGKTKNGFSIGVLESLTQREKAEIDLSGDRRKEEVEPLTNYFAGRVEKDFDKGNTILGGMITSTNRKIENVNIDFLAKNAYSGGINFAHYWKNKAWKIGLKAVISSVNGDSAAITNIQRSPVHYFQRPDADYVEVDSSKTSLQGHGGTVEFGKYGEGHWRFVTWVTWRSPGLELNDVGYLRCGDEIFQVLWIAYRIWEPFSIFRSLNFNFNQWSGWDFGGRSTFKGSNINFNMNFKNYWGFHGGFNVEGFSLSKSALRGGPSLKSPGGYNFWMGVGSDERKKIVFAVDFGFYNQFQNAGRFRDISLYVRYRPSDALKLTVSPFLALNNYKIQYVTTADYDNKDRYITASIDQTTFGFTFRADYSITPDLSIQYYGQPFISSGDYSKFKRITDPLASKFQDSFHLFTENEISYNEENEIYEVDENHDGVVDYDFENPNFNFMQFRSNLVLRWEYIPGSTLFFVWTQGRTDVTSLGEFRFRDDFNDLFSTHPHNVFLIKLSYRFQL